MELKNVEILAEKFIFGHISVILFHKVGPYFDDIIVEIKMITHENIAICLKKAYQGFAHDVVFKNYFIDFCIPDFEINLTFTCLCENEGSENKHDVFCSLVDIKP